MDELIDAAQHVASATGFSGVVRIDRDGETSSEAYGLAHRGLGVPNTAATQFAIASGSKAFTALAVVSLIVEGALSLDMKARSVLGQDLPLIDDNVTIEQLLAHRSGIGDYLDEEEMDLDLTDYVLVSPVHRLDTTEPFLAEIEGRPTKFPAGERFAYSNGGYVVLALIAERVSGIGFHDLIGDRVLTPAGLKDTAFLRSDEPSGRMALGYLHPDGLRTNVLHLPVRGNGDGGIYTTVADMHNFWEAFFAGLVVPENWVAEMTRPRSEIPVEDARYGLGFWLASSGHGVRLVGSDAGVSFYSEHDPTERFTWTVISNTTEGAWPMVRSLRSGLGT